MVVVGHPGQEGRDLRCAVIFGNILLWALARRFEVADVRKGAAGAICIPVACGLGLRRWMVAGSGVKLVKLCEKVYCQIMYRVSHVESG